MNQKNYSRSSQGARGNSDLGFEDTSNGQAQLNPRGRAAVNNYLKKLAIGLVVANITVLGSVVAGTRYWATSVQSDAEDNITASIKSAEDKAIAAVIARIKESKEVNSILVENIKNTVTASNEIFGSVKALRDRVKDTLHDQEKILKDQRNAVAKLREDVNRVVTEAEQSASSANALQKALTANLESEKAKLSTLSKQVQATQEEVENSASFVESVKKQAVDIKSESMISERPWRKHVKRTAT